MPTCSATRNLIRLITKDFLNQMLKMGQGDMVVCDNRATMHRAHGDYDRRYSRMLWRIILEGDRPA
ncbi:MAG: TauD/TfdA family dioxygenase [Alphaproteobacteria bacterium]|nr:TauD/TfdA family dioxygenase [Alphaproteobacteria bacterium]